MESPPLRRSRARAVVHCLPLQYRASSQLFTSYEQRCKLAEAKAMTTVDAIRLEVKVKDLYRHVAQDPGTRRQREIRREERLAAGVHQTDE